jgi:arsenite-transporting ATPase
MANAKVLLTDPAKTAFFFVTLPEALPIAVITRFIQWFHDFGIPVGGVIVNGLIQKETVKADAPEFVRNRVKMQDEHMGEIWQAFGDGVRSIVPLFDNEIQGPEALRKLADKLFA